MPDVDLGTVAAGVNGVAGLVTTAINAISAGATRRRQMKLLNQRKAFKTPSEIYDILRASQYNASNGISQSTLDFLSNKLGERTASSIEAIRSMGGDKNLISSIFQSGAQESEGIAQMDIAESYKKYNTYLDALKDMAANKAAVQKSKDDLIKDKLQAERLNLTNENKAISGGLNMVNTALTTLATRDLYRDKGNDNPDPDDPGWV